MRLATTLFCCALLGASSMPTSGVAQETTTIPAYGATVFPLGFPETTPRDIQLLNGAGIDWARIAVPWRSVEAGCKSCYDWRDLDRVVATLNAADVKILARITHPPAWARAVPADNGPPDAISDYVDFVKTVAQRYRDGSPIGTIHAISVWNEPNLSRDWGGATIDRAQAAQYMYLLKEAYRGVKAVDPTKLVVSAGLSPTGTADGTAQPDDVYLGWMYENGLARYSDVVGMHAPGFGSPPEAEPGSDPRFPHPSFYFRRVEQLRAIMEANGDGAKPVWLVEFGWTTDQINPDRRFYAVTPEQQADYLIRGFQYAHANWSSWVGVIFIWSLVPDPNWTPADEQYWWSITNADGSPRPAYTALVRARTSGLLP